jgi:hypothetical protein
VKSKKPSAQAGFVRRQADDSAYPAGNNTGIRRARDVIPAAMRALVRTCAVAKLDFIEERLILDG